MQIGSKTEASFMPLGTNFESKRMAKDTPGSHVRKESRVSRYEHWAKLNSRRKAL